MLFPRLRFGPVQAATRRDRAAYESGGDGSRTHDLSIANAALSQLSYTPVHSRSLIGNIHRWASFYGPAAG